MTACYADISLSGTYVSVSPRMQGASRTLRPQSRFSLLIQVLQGWATTTVADTIIYNTARGAKMQGPIRTLRLQPHFYLYGCFYVGSQPQGRIPSYTSRLAARDIEQWTDGLIGTAWKQLDAWGDRSTGGCMARLVKSQSTHGDRVVCREEPPSSHHRIRSSRTSLAS